MPDTPQWWSWNIGYMTLMSNEAGAEVASLVKGPLCRGNPSFQEELAQCPSSQRHDEDFNMIGLWDNSRPQCQKVPRRVLMRFCDGVQSMTDVVD